MDRRNTAKMINLGPQEVHLQNIFTQKEKYLGIFRFPQVIFADIVSGPTKSYIGISASHRRISLYTNC
jgi:hypothetical protein